MRRSWSPPESLSETAEDLGLDAGFRIWDLELELKSGSSRGLTEVKPLILSETRVFQHRRNPGLEVWRGEAWGCEVVV